MSDNGTSSTPEQEELRAEIERTREDLAQTVDELTDRLDVKARLHDKVDHVKQDVSDQVHYLADRATDDQGRPTPPVLVAAVALLGGIVVVLLLRRRKAGR